MSTISVTIYGPNLPRPLCDKGTLHVHAAGCRDGRRYPKGADQAGWTIEAGSLYDIVNDCYPAGEFEWDGIVNGKVDSDDFHCYLGDIFVAPCVSLPTLPDGVTFGTADDVEAAAFVCGTCGRSWTEPTPAGRCPYEYDHAEVPASGGTIFCVQRPTYGVEVVATPDGRYDVRWTDHVANDWSEPFDTFALALAHLAALDACVEDEAVLVSRSARDVLAAAFLSTTHSK
jgi:hypothetical protein